jgi:hypothetical protein
MKIFTSTKVTWPNPDDAPTEESVIDKAHVTANGGRVTIRKKNDNGRMDVVDTIIDAVWKGQGEKATVTGKSHFMIDKVQIPYDEADVTVEIVAKNKQCLTC